MNVNTIQLDPEIAKQKYKEYLEAVKIHKSQEYNAVRRAYRALSKGMKIIDIYDAFKQTGLKADGRPKLAIVRADAKKVYFTKVANGAGRFSLHQPHSWNRHEIRSDVNLPESIFPPWGLINPNELWRGFINQDSETNVPIIPASVTMPGKTENYYILFEVSQWSTIAKVRDPYLLQRLSDNTFIVLDEWDVTEVEAIVMRAR